MLISWLFLLGTASSWTVLDYRLLDYCYRFAVRLGHGPKASLFFALMRLHLDKEMLSLMVS